MKERVNKLFKDKLVLVMLVLGLLTIVAAAGTMTIHKGNSTEETPYLQMGESQKEIAEKEEVSVRNQGTDGRSAGYTGKRETHSISSRYKKREKA